MNQNPFGNPEQIPSGMMNGLVLTFWIAAAVVLISGVKLVSCHFAGVPLQDCGWLPHLASCLVCSPLSAQCPSSWLTCSTTPNGVGARTTAGAGTANPAPTTTISLNRQPAKIELQSVPVCETSRRTSKPAAATRPG